MKGGDYITEGHKWKYLEIASYCAGGFREDCNFEEEYILGWNDVDIDEEGFENSIEIVTVRKCYFDDSGAYGFEIEYLDDEVKKDERVKKLVLELVNLGA